MGGDHAPAIIFEGIQHVLKKPEAEDALFYVFGIESVLKPLLAKYQFADRVILVPCADVITGTTEPRLAIRGLKDSSMRRAIESVAEGQTHGVVSAGNTGAYMALSKLILKTLDGIYRPAITTTMPTLTTPFVMLDLGANVDVTPETMVQFCLMGQTFAKCVLHLENPTVALLNIGSEELKGNTMVKEAHLLIQKTGVIPHYKGFIEGNHIFDNIVNVVVTDGFTGNVALKTIEGTVQLLTRMIKEELTRTWQGKLGGFLAQSSFSAFKNRIDPRRYNGAPFLGLNGISVKSHGGTDGFGFASALLVALDMVRHNINDRIRHEVLLLQEELAMLP